MAEEEQRDVSMEFFEKVVYAALWPFIKWTLITSAITITGIGVGLWLDRTLSRGGVSSKRGRRLRQRLGSTAEGIAS